MKTGKNIEPKGRKPIQRKTELKRKTWIKRASLERSKTPKDREFYKHKARSTLTRKKRLKQVSKKHRQQIVNAYWPIQTQFMALPSSRWCIICLCRSLDLKKSEILPVLQMPQEEGDAMLRIAGGKLEKATENHHYAGRIGRLLCYVPFFTPSCRGCREWPHRYLAQARELELIAPAHLYDVFPEGHTVWQKFLEENPGVCHNFDLIEDDH